MFKVSVHEVGVTGSIPTKQEQSIFFVLLVENIIRAPGEDVHLTTLNTHLTTA